MPAPRTRRFHPVLLLMLIVILAVTIGHMVSWVSMPLVCIAFLVAAVLVAAGHLRRLHPRQDR